MKKNNHGSTPGKTIMKQDIVMFNELTNSAINPVSTPPSLIVMLSIGLLNRTLPLEEHLIAVVGQSWEFFHEVEIGDTLKVDYLISDIKLTKSGDKAIANIKVDTFNQKQQNVASGLWKILIYYRKEKNNDDK